MGIEDDFFATIKLKCGDEIFAKVAASEEDDRTMLLVSNPICVEEVKTRGNVSGYKFEPWLKTTKEDKQNYSKLDRKMGYLGNVHDTKEVLEKLFNNS